MLEREGQRRKVNDWREGETPNLTRCTEYPLYVPSLVCLAV